MYLHCIVRRRGISENTKNIHITFIQRRPTSVQHCINVIQWFCVCWDCEWVITQTGGKCHPSSSPGLSVSCYCPASTRCWVNAVFMLDQRRRRWANMKPALAQHNHVSWSMDRDRAWRGMQQTSEVVHRAGSSKWEARGPLEKEAPIYNYPYCIKYHILVA